MATMTILTLHDILYMHEPHYFEEAWWDTQKPFNSFMQWLQRIQESAFVMEIEEEDDFTKAEQNNLFNEIDGWLRDEEADYNARSEAIASMSAGSSKTISRFNDTPQSAGNYDTKPYSSTVTTSESSGELSSESKLRLIRSVAREARAEFMRRFVIHEP